MTVEIIIGVTGLLLSVFTYFAGVWRTEKRLSREDRSNRIDRVLEKYMGFRRTYETSGLDGLQKAGVATLSSDSEIHELIDLIIKHREKNPLGAHARLLDAVDLKVFFDFAARKHVNFFDTPIDDVIDESKSQRKV